VLGVTDDAVQLVLSGRKGISQLEVPFADISRAKVEVEFSPPAAAVLAVLGVEAAVEPDEVDEDAYGEEFDDELDDEAGADDAGVSATSTGEVTG
jgi:ribosome maturation factor RimP